MAEKIVRLLLNDSGIGGLLSQQLKNRHIITPVASAVSAPKKRKKRKLTDPVVRFLLENRGTSMEDLLVKVHAAFGFTLSSGSVYKVWTMHA